MEDSEVSMAEEAADPRQRLKGCYDNSHKDLVRCFTDCSRRSFVDRRPLRLYGPGNALASALLDVLVG